MLLLRCFTELARAAPPLRTDESAVTTAELVGSRKVTCATPKEDRAVDWTRTQLRRPPICRCVTPNAVRRAIVVHFGYRRAEAWVAAVTAESLGLVTLTVHATSTLGASRMQPVTLRAVCFLWPP